MQEGTLQEILNNKQALDTFFGETDEYLARSSAELDEFSDEDLAAEMVAAECYERQARQFGALVDALA